MNADQLKAYKREKSRLFNAKMRDLRLRDKENKQTADQPDKQEKQDNLTLQDLMDIYETLDTKMDIIQTKLETIMENKLYEPLETKMDIIQNKLETIIENKISEETFKTKLENNTLLPQFKPIFFA